MRVVLTPGGTVQKRDTITELAIASLTIVLAGAKSKLLPGQEVTGEDVQKLLDLIYDDDWQPGHFIETPDEGSATATHKNRGFVQGTLLESLEESPKSAGAAKAKGRSQAAKTISKNTAKRTLGPKRRVGATVWLLSEHRSSGSISFSFRDRAGQIMTSRAKVLYADGMSVKDVYFHSMHKNDEFFGKTCHAFNMDQVFYICQNRLTYWSNPGIAVGTLPPQENPALSLVDLNFCRYSNHINGAPSASAADLHAQAEAALLSARRTPYSCMVLRARHNQKLTKQDTRRQQRELGI